MTTNIIIQCVLIILIGGGIAGVIKLPPKQKWIGILIILIQIIGSILIWTIH
jgi:hypothetical protein